MAENEKHFLTKETVPTENLPRGIHHWLSSPETTGSDQLLTVRVEVEAGNGHPFHHHPNMDEIIYVLSGKAEQWLEEESKILEKDEAVFIPKKMVHATFNAGDEPLVFLAILSPAKDLEGSGMVDVSDEEPWCKLR
ncbi:cupin domain-containing protein [Aliifodinibius sp. S!AR15-10]|uniref:cupin domain-containing protein n=1 Tax=Aliifodinibius sp. S!AR15-10 TaxID=2950437 RepID=UPI002865F978|nr:cupin domain-containing protein [Aliifodinibius sp. S!AR15-10]MDR8390194.1 cupin domain-containing protein [Aliifodinibius sp. S!AR15-10]